ncbi:MAG: tetratricopeptide repeat protein [Candidatus Melainabacteria bacterium]|nr:tetratricopeptide repeat protein [Candidatus Melainabacteria bacterium]
MVRYPRRRRKRSLFNNFYLNPRAQYVLTIFSAMGLAALIFSGFLLFRYSDSGDLIARGKQQMAEGKVAWAAHTFQMLVRRDPNNYEGHFLLGQAYLELGDRRKGEQELKIASALRSKNPGAKGGNGVDIAMSKLAMAQNRFDEAESGLKQAYQKNPNNVEVQEALFDLYEYWGDADSATSPPDLANAIRHYDQALAFATDYQSEESLKEKLVSTMRQQATEHFNAKQTDAGLAVLKEALRYRYAPEILVEIANIYESHNKLDDAIAWYRKAFDANPDTISLRLSNILTRKGRLLLDQKKPQEAERYFDEARKISEMTQIPPHVLYPVKVTKVNIQAQDLEPQTGEFTPEVSALVENKADRPLNFLVLKATFLSGDQVLDQASMVVASLKEPLAPKGLSGSSRSVSLKAGSKSSLHMLKEGQLQVKLSVAYNEGESPDWQVKALQEGQIRMSIPADTEEGEETPETSRGNASDAVAPSTQRRSNSTSTNPQGGSARTHQGGGVSNPSGSNSSAPVPTAPVPNAPPTAPTPPSPPRQTT